MDIPLDKDVPSRNKAYTTFGYGLIGKVILSKEIYMLVLGFFFYNMRKKNAGNLLVCKRKKNNQ